MRDIEKSRTRLAACGMALAALLAAAPAFAQSANDTAPPPHTSGNQQPAPGNTAPADPSAGSNPAARVPTDQSTTSPAGASSGSAAGTSGGTTLPPSSQTPSSNSVNRGQPGSPVR